MGSSYYITYGGNRLTFPGATGSVAWEYNEVVPVTRYEYKLWTTPNGSGSANGTLPSALSAFDEFIVAYSIKSPSYTRQYQTFNGTANDVCLNGLMTDGGASPWGFYMAEVRFSSNATNWVVVNNTGSCNWWMGTRCGQTNGWTADGYGANKLNGVYEIIGVKYQ